MGFGETVLQSDCVKKLGGWTGRTGRPMQFLDIAAIVNEPGQLGEALPVKSTSQYQTAGAIAEPEEDGASHSG